jgi:hypothetical protein
MTGYSVVRNAWTATIRSKTTLRRRISLSVKEILTEQDKEQGNHMGNLNLIEEIRNHQKKRQSDTVQNTRTYLQQLSTDELLNELSRVQDELRVKEAEIEEEKAIEISIISILYDRGGISIPA